jgi:hypothetical protein
MKCTAPIHIIKCTRAIARLAQEQTMSTKTQRRLAALPKESRCSCDTSSNTARCGLNIYEQQLFDTVVGFFGSILVAILLLCSFILYRLVKP